MHSPPKAITPESETTPKATHRPWCTFGAQTGAQTKKARTRKALAWCFMEPATGFEPATGSLQNCYATIASYRHTKMRVGPLYDNNPDSQSLSHKRYNHHRQDIARHVTRPHVRKRRWKTPLPSVLAPFAEPSFHVRHCSCEQKHRWS